MAPCRQNLRVHFHRKVNVPAQGLCFDRMDDEARSLHYYQEAYRAFPGNMDVISWLGAFHVRNEVYEKAVPFFIWAAKLQPAEVKWELMVASCHRYSSFQP